ncbi:MAG: sensor histidine kinase [Chloroflexi bacterium]|nr:MAG: sensor histidine kinase [Chloroflexota bacterium]MBL1196717.1 sensor histidine kinase [Chloroflexota bacterium]NOH14010.1 sensor histidine kinase [Chloroflexota bacterium]
MHNKTIEPGLIQVFRGYAFLRLLLVFLSLIGLVFVALDLPAPIDFGVPLGGDPAKENRGRGILAVEFDPTFYTVALGLEVLLLLTYLYWPRLKTRLKSSYLPIGIGFATLALILETYITIPFARLFQPDPFLFILVILLAWQYNLRSVLLFALGTVGLEIILDQLIPVETLNIYRFGPASANTLFYGRMIARTAAFLALGFVITRLMRGQREQREALARANLRLTQYAATQEQLAVIRERNRISRELHDTLAHTLSALTVQLDAVTTVWKDVPTKARQMLDQMLGTTRLGLDETRRALQDLRASPLEDMGLPQALRSLSEDFAKRNALELDMEISDAIEDLAPEVEQSIYRIAQEALENVSRHANARLVKVQLQQQNEAVSLSISDDGRGFDADEIDHQDKFGLQGVRERAEVIGAELEIESHKNEGTRLHLNWKSAQ